MFNLCKKNSIVAEMIKLFTSNFGESQIDYFEMEPCNLHDLCSCIDSHEFFCALLNWDTKFYHYSAEIIFMISNTNFILRVFSN